MSKKSKIYFHVFAQEYPDAITHELDEWLDFMQEGDNNIEIVSVTQSVEDGLIVLTVFARDVS